MAKAKRKNRVAVFCSGSGSNFEAICKNASKGLLDCQIVCMFCDRPDAYAFVRAEKLGVPSLFLSPKAYKDKSAYEKAIVKELALFNVDWIVLAGYMRILSPYFIRKFRNRIVNIHPSLLPAFKGADAIGDALKYGAKITGVTVHLVDEQVDHGPIIMQKAVEIKQGDDKDTLAQRIHRVEHKLYTQALNLLFNRKWKIEKGRKFVLID